MRLWYSVETLVRCVISSSRAGFEALSVVPPANFAIDRGCGMNDRASEWNIAGGAASSQVSCEQA